MAQRPPPSEAQPEPDLQPSRQPSPASPPDDAVSRERRERIRRRAHAIWLDEGQVHGRDPEHWRQAESEIDAEDEEPGRESMA